MKEEHLQSVKCHVLSRVTCHMSRSNAPQAPGHQELLAAEGVVGAAVTAAAASTSSPHCLGCCRGPSSASAAASEPADEVGEVAEESLHFVHDFASLFTVRCSISAFLSTTCFFTWASTLTAVTETRTRQTAERFMVLAVAGTRYNT